MNRAQLSLAALLCAGCAHTPASEGLLTGKPIFGIHLDDARPASAEALRRAGLEIVEETGNVLDGARVFSKYSDEKLRVYLAPDGSRRPQALLITLPLSTPLLPGCFSPIVGAVEGLGLLSRIQDRPDLFCLNGLVKEESEYLGPYGALLWTRDLDALLPRLGHFVSMAQLAERWRKAWAARDMDAMERDRLLWIRADRKEIPEIAEYERALEAQQQAAKALEKQRREEAEANQARVLASLDPELVSLTEREWAHDREGWKPNLVSGQISALLPTMRDATGVLQDGKTWGDGALRTRAQFAAYLDAARTEALARGKLLTAAALTALIGQFRSTDGEKEKREAVPAAALAETRALVARKALELLPLQVVTEGPRPLPPRARPADDWLADWLTGAAGPGAVRGQATLVRQPKVSVVRSAQTSKEQVTRDSWEDVPVGATPPPPSAPAVNGPLRERRLDRLDEIDAAIAVQKQRLGVGIGDKAASSAVVNPNYDPTSSRSNPASSVQGGGLTGSASWRIQDAENEIFKLEQEKRELERQLTGPAPTAPASTQTKRVLRTYVVGSREVRFWDYEVRDRLALTLPDGTRTAFDCHQKASVRDPEGAMSVEEATREAWRRVDLACAPDFSPVWRGLEAALQVKALAAAAREEDPCEAKLLRLLLAGEGAQETWREIVCIPPRRVPAPAKP